MEGSVPDDGVDGYALGTNAMDRVRFPECVWVRKVPVDKK